MGAWIEIKNFIQKFVCNERRTPRWVRGLKFTGVTRGSYLELSHPTMGAWIEIFIAIYAGLALISSHPTMGAWIEIRTNDMPRMAKLGRTPRWVRGLKYHHQIE